MVLQRSQADILGPEDDKMHDLGPKESQEDPNEPQDAAQGPTAEHGHRLGRRLRPRGREHVRDHRQGHR